MKWAILILIAINMAGFLLMAIDKLKARYGRWRIKESLLLGVAIAFGAAGVYSGLKVFKHKTKHKLFTITLPVLIFIQVAALIWLAQHFSGR
jgi:uncharacterized membrane protein YsdA (DUF1294 family)